MKKIVLISLFLVTSACFGQWFPSGNTESIKAYHTGIRDFVISEDSKFIYTLDDNGVIKTWDYETGDSLAERILKPITTYGKLENWIFLSLDGKTYCTSNLFISENKYYNSIQIYNIGTGILIDSLLIGIPYNINYIINSNDNALIDYCSEKKKLINSFNFSYYSHAPKLGNTSGMTYLLKKEGNNWISLYSTDGFLEYYCCNKNSDMIFQSFTGSGWYQYRRYHASANSETNIILNTISGTQYLLSDYQYKYESDNNITIEGREYGFKSAFFGDMGNTLYLSESDRIYKYNISNKELGNPKSITRYHLYPYIRIEYCPVDNFFYILRKNILNIHDVNNYDYFNSFEIDYVDSIVAFKNSKDIKYVFFTDLYGRLYRIENSKIFKLKSNFQSPDTIASLKKEVYFFDRSIGSPETYEWDFGDGTASAEKNPVHTYQNTGKYSVRLIISGKGLRDTVLKPDYIEVLPELKADFDYELTGSNPVTGKFINKSIGEIDSVLWDFGDSTIDKNEHPGHNFVFSGSYNVKLRIFCRTLTDTIEKKIDIYVADLELDKNKYSYEFSDTTVTGSVAIKGWEEEGGYIVYHIDGIDSLFLHGAYRNFKQEWNNAKSIGKEFLVRQEPGKYLYLSDSLIKSITSNGVLINSNKYQNSNNIMSINKTNGGFISTYLNMNKYCYDIINEINLTAASRSIRWIDYVTNAIKFDLKKHIAYLDGNKLDYSTFAIRTEKNPNGGSAIYSIKIFSLNSNLTLPHNDFNDFIRLNDSALVILTSDTLKIIRNYGLDVDSNLEKPSDCKILYNIGIRNFAGKSLLKLNDTVFAVAGDYNKKPACFIINSVGKITDSLVLNERTGSFQFISITPDGNLLLSGYRKKYFGFPSPYFVKTNDSFIRLLIKSATDKPPKNILLNDLVCIPNPANESTEIRFNLSRNFVVKCRLFNSLGNEVQAMEPKLYNSGSNTINIYLAGLPIGNYYYCLEAGGYVYSGIIAHIRE